MDTDQITAISREIDPSTDNGRRALRALRALRSYWGADGEDAVGTMIGDLLADLMHLWDAVERSDMGEPNEDWAAIIDRAEMNHGEEVEMAPQS